MHVSEDRILGVIKMERALPVLDGQVSRAAVKSVRVVAGGLSIALRVRRISGGYTISSSETTWADLIYRDRIRTVVDVQPGHGQRGGVGDTVDTCRRVQNLDVLS